MSVIFTRIRVKITLVRVETTLRVKSHSAYGNRTLRVEINILRVELTLVSVIITLIPIKITLCVLKSQSRVP
jgi:hypothetical protein